MNGRSAENLIGRKFGRLVVIERAISLHGNRGARWLCRCECGNTRIARADKFSRIDISCDKGDCHHAITHNAHRSRTYTSWRSMNARCNRPTHHKYALYGGRGITICERWKSFANFFEDMGERPAGMTLDRKDGNKGYSKENCQWATASMQNKNRERRKAA